MNSIIRNIFFGIIIFYLQLIFMPKLRLFGVIPDIYIAFAIILGFRSQLIESVLILLFFGIAGDLFNPDVFGSHTFGLLLITILVNHYHNSINKEKIVSVFVGIFVLVFLMMIITFINVFSNYPQNIISLMFKYSFYNVIITAIILLVYNFISHIRFYLDV